MATIGERNDDHLAGGKSLPPETAAMPTIGEHSGDPVCECCGRSCPNEARYKCLGCDRIVCLECVGYLIGDSRCQCTACVEAALKARDLARQAPMVKA
jgi:hypothetical protein